MWGGNLFRSLYNSNIQSFADGLRRFRTPYFNFLADQINPLPQSSELVESFHFSQLPVTRSQVDLVQQFLNSAQNEPRPIFDPDDFSDNVITEFSLTGFFRAADFRGDVSEKVRMAQEQIENLSVNIPAVDLRSLGIPLDSEWRRIQAFINTRRAP